MRTCVPLLVHAADGDCVLDWSVVTVLLCAVRIQQVKSMSVKSENSQEYAVRGTISSSAALVRRLERKRVPSMAVRLQDVPVSLFRHAFQYSICVC